MLKDDGESSDVVVLSVEPIRRDHETNALY